MTTQTNPNPNPNQKQSAAPSAAKPLSNSSGVSLPIVYRLFFLVIEPAAALVGAFFAHFRQDRYLALTHLSTAPSSSSSPTPLGTSIVLSQLANLYLFFALNEALVLRSTTDLKVWRTVLFVLLVADLGHLYTLRGLGPDIYYAVGSWNAIDWGNVPFVYLGAATRIAFLGGVGFAGRRHQNDIDGQKRK